MEKFNSFELLRRSTAVERGIHIFRNCACNKSIDSIESTEFVGVENRLNEAMPRTDVWPNVLPFQKYFVIRYSYVRSGNHDEPSCQINTCHWWKRVCW